MSAGKEEWYSFESTFVFSGHMLGNFVLPVPNNLAEKVLAGYDKKDKRIIARVEGLEAFRCALQHDGKGGFQIFLNKERVEQLKQLEGTERRVSIQKDVSEFGMDIPPELEELWRQDSAAKKFFLLQKPGTLRSLIYIVAKPKTSATRLRKALAISDYLQSTNGKLDFPQMLEHIKNFQKV